MEYWYFIQIVDFYSFLTFITESDKNVYMYSTADSINAEHNLDGLLINPKVINRAIKYLISSVLLISKVIYR